MSTEETSRLDPSPVPQPHSPPPRRPVNGCLALLLCLMLLVGLIAAASFHQKQRFIENVRRVDTRVCGKGIADAVMEYYADQAHFPGPPMSGTAKGMGTDTETDTSDEEGLIRILVGREPEPGPMSPHRGINHLEGMKSAKFRSTGPRQAEAKGSDRWVSGLVDDRGRLEAVDGWGGYFRIRLDTDGDREVVNPNLEEAAAGRPKLSVQAIVWSAGKDGKWETWDDNVKSWD
ncbi:MAG: hypothetical protein JWM59_2963 [Verrucomicrobiales bacterium]|nr:hypothetical protein [Verrucomicrobiales bacterium]